MVLSVIDVNFVFEVDGCIIWMVDVGDVVKVGEFLVKVDDICLSIICN